MRVVPLAAALAGLMLAGASAARADDSCASARNGVCDELKTCHLGTDTTDCAAACAGPWTPQIAGACAHYAQARVNATPPPAGPDPGSHGSGGPGGYYGESIVASWTRTNTTNNRYYTVYVPRTYDPRVATPLVLYYAGNGVDWYSVLWFHEMMRAADLMGYILVSMGQPYLNTPPQDYYSWLIYTSDWQGDWSQNPDVDFTRRTVEYLKTRYNIDRTRIFATGHSRGAALSISLAFELPHLIAGFQSEMGFIRPQAYDTRMKQIWKGGRKIPGIMMHGMIDDNVDYSNSVFIAATLTSMGWVEGQDFLFFRFPNVGHDWQRQFNQETFDFLRSHPLPLEMAAP